MDRASVPNTLRQLYALYHDGNPLLPFRFEVTDPLAVMLNPTFNAQPLIQTVNTFGCRGMVFGDEKNIGSLKTGPGSYTLNFDFPGEGGKRYLVGISVSGYNPGLTLADGRNVCLNFDALTFASLTNRLVPAFDPGPGTLDSTGRATGAIALGVDGWGILIHMVAMTLSPTMIDTISSPVALRL